jgi:hypothetical protein
MADTKHHTAHHTADIPIESDGVSYSGLIWFTVVLAGSAVVIQLLMWGMFKFMEAGALDADVARPPLAAPAGSRPAGVSVLSLIWPQAPEGVYTPDEPTNLKRFRSQEDLELTTYGWSDQNTGTMRIPIDRAKALLLQRGLPVRGQQPAAAPVKK